MRAHAGGKLGEHMHDGGRLLARDDGARHLVAGELLAIQLLDDPQIIGPAPAAIRWNLDAGLLDIIFVVEDGLPVGGDGQRADLAAPRIHRIERLRNIIGDVSVLVRLDELVERQDPFAFEILAEPHLIDRDDIGIGLIADEG